MTKRCKHLKEENIGMQFCLVCRGTEKQCPKNRLKCKLGQSCWQVRGK